MQLSQDATDVAGQVDIRQQVEKSTIVKAFKAENREQYRFTFHTLEQNADVSTSSHAVTVDSHIRPPSRQQ